MDKLTAILCLLFVSQVSISQDLERKNIYYGNKAYDEKEFDDAIGYYQEALNASPLSFKSNFNMANAYFKKGDFQTAADLYAAIIDLAPTAFDRSKVYHNLGNAHFLNQKLDDAIDAYKEALKINPADEDSRYNLAYALLLKSQQPEQDQEQNEDENNEDQNSEDQNEENKNSDENQNKNEDKSNDSNGQNNDKKTEQKNASQQNRISKEQAKRILDAALKKEKEVQKKMEKYKIVGTGESSKKDW